MEESCSSTITLKGYTHAISNYRPVSLVSCVSKVLERVVHKHMYNYILDNELLYKYQSGFLTCHSTIFQLVELYDNVCQNLESRKHTCLVFCDISKAFYGIWNSGLLHKFKSFGFNGIFHSCLGSYLNNRKQVLLLNNTVANEGFINVGVPQGSVLGPLLFVLYIYDIADNLESLARLFADNTSLSYSSTSTIDIETKINHDLERLQGWSEKWLTTFNPTKTEVLIISNSENGSDMNLRFNNSRLELSTVHMDLGVTLSNDTK